MLVIGVIGSIAISLFKNIKPEINIAFACAVLLGSIYLTASDRLNEGITLFGGVLTTPSVAGYYKIFISCSALVTLLLTLTVKRHNKISEHVTLILTMVFGGNLLVMSNHMLMIFLSIELISIPSYLLTGFKFSKTSAEGSLKYFLYGAAASAFMLYGFTMLYGVTGSLVVNETISSGSQNTMMVITGAAMVFGGFLFKLAAAPMHFWAPDIYESAPTPVTALLSTAPKIAVIAVIVKLAPAFAAVRGIDTQHALAFISILSIIVGNFGALAQHNPKRMMAYSSIAQSGFMLIGIVAAPAAGMDFLLFYVAAYVVSNLLVFSMLVYFEHNGVNSVMEFSGTGFTHFFPSVFLLIGLISLTGLPPTAGFTAKLFIFSALWEAFEHSGETILLILFIVGLLNTVVSLFYYLKIPYYSFLKAGETPEKQNIITIPNLLAAVMVLMLLGWFFIPGILMRWINTVTFAY